jgi:1-acyl-sn-glycerol-3-phosphate acyltransferase
MGIFLGIIRLFLLLGALIVFTPTALILSFLPFLTYRKAPVAAWAVTWVARLAILILGVQVVCDDRQKIARHDGLIFPNHVSYLDIVVMMSFAPMRFLAKESISRWLFIGQMAKAIGCVFVKRQDKDSRRTAREKLTQIPMPPPMVIYPEGKTGPGGVLLPFRYGAFDIAIQTGRPFLPCPIIHNREDVVGWGGEETFPVAAWRLVRHIGKLTATVVPLDAVQPSADDDAQTLAEATFEKMKAVMPYEQIV